MQLICLICLDVHLKSVYPCGVPAFRFPACVCGHDHTDSLINHARRAINPARPVSSGRRMTPDRADTAREGTPALARQTAGCNTIPVSGGARIYTFLSPFIWVVILAFANKTAQRWERRAAKDNTSTSVSKIGRFLKTR